MKKNVAGQFISAQMITRADGTDFTGTVSVAVTIDNGTQTAGAGTVTHKGTGHHSYAPTQAETNGDRVVFTFTGTGAITASPQVFTSFPQTGDNFPRLGAPAGASVSADNAAIKSTVDAIPTTAMRGTDGVDTATMRGTDGALTDKAGFSLSTAGILAIWNQLTSALTTASTIGKLLVDNIDAAISSRNAVTPPTAVQNRTEMDSNSTQLAKLGTPAGASMSADTAAVKTVVDGIPTTPMRGTDGVDTATMRGTDGVDTATMRGTDGANTVTPLSFTDMWETTDLTEDYAANGAAFNPAQALYMIWSDLRSPAQVGTVWSDFKVNNTTVSMTFSLDDATTPTKKTRTA